MSTRQVIVELSHGRIEVAILRGRAPARAASAAIQLGHDTWIQDLAGTAATLKKLVADLGADGAEATLLYAGTSAVTGIFSCAKAAGQHQAVDAARLALGETAHFPLETNPHALVLLTRDRATDDSAPCQSHTLGVAENDQTAQALFAWLGGAGLVPRVLIPIEAPAVAAAARQVLDASKSGAACALFVGDYGSVFAGASKGRLKFLRQIGLGTESLVAALAREFRPSGAGESITLSLEDARELLFRSGIPSREQCFDEGRGIQGDAVLPLLQPVLQRWLVEIKQSLRFGFEEAERAGALLLPMGTGAAVPRLHQIVADQCTLKLAPATAELGRGAVAVWIAEPIKNLNVLPVSVVGKKDSFRLTRGMWVGVAAACVAMGVDAFITRTDLAKVRSQTHELDSRLQAALPGVRMKEKLIATRAATVAAQARMRMRLSPCTNWDAVLAALARETPERVRLIDIRLGVEVAQPYCRISGETPLESSSDVLKTYSDLLASLPIVSSYRMGATSRGESLLGPVQQFEMTLGVVDLPPGAGAPPTLANVPELEDQP